MNWDECVEQAKEELSINSWTEDWDKVISLAKEIYWKGNTFKELKENTIISASGFCKLCSSRKNLTAHHIFYGRNETAICVCSKCHKIITEMTRKWGFVMQLVLLNLSKDYETPSNLSSICSTCRVELIKACRITSNFRKMIGKKDD